MRRRGNIRRQQKDHEGRKQKKSCRHFRKTLSRLPAGNIVQPPARGVMAIFCNSEKTG